MKAVSCGLESSIGFLTDEQINGLPNKSIEGILMFREVLSKKVKKIAFELRYNEKQKGFVKVNLIPNEIYFGEANKIIFSINKSYYKDLREYGVAEGARFLTNGKLNLVSEKIKYPRTLI